MHLLFLLLLLALFALLSPLRTDGFAIPLKKNPIHKINNNPNVNIAREIPMLYASSSSSSSRSSDDDNAMTQKKKNAIYELLSTPRDNDPGRCNFFYNDEVISHLHGYMYLVGGLVRDETFFLSFLILAAIAAGGTVKGLLPANARIPGIVALLTLLFTILCRYIFDYELHFFDDLIITGGGGGGQQLPIDDDDQQSNHANATSIYYEIIICLLNIGWGFGGRWKTKEQIDGATFGF